MIQSTDLLRYYIRGIKRLSGAGLVSLYVPASLGGALKTVLIHEGEPPLIPELTDLVAAAEFQKKAELRLAEAGGEAAERRVQQVSSQSPDSRLLRVPSDQSLLVLTSMERARDDKLGTNSRWTDRVTEPTEPLPAVWVGLRSENAEDAFPDPSWSLQLPPTETNREQSWIWLLSLGGALAIFARQVSEILDDPVTGLPGRTEFQSSLRQALESARESGKSVSLILMNPDDFAAVNERFGQKAGDTAIREIAQRFRASHRRSEMVAKYGAAIFASLLVDTDTESSRTVAEKVLCDLTEGAYLDGEAHLSFSVGAATFAPPDESVHDPLDLIRRADQALKAAKGKGGNDFAVWEPRFEVEDLGGLDRLSGIFTGNMAKDYRNMALLSDTVTVVAGSADFEELAAQVVEKLFSTLRLHRVALLLEGLTTKPWEVGSAERSQSLELVEAELIKAAREQRQALDARFPVQTSHGECEVFSCAIPLMVNRECVGCLYLESRADWGRLDSSDLVFLKALAAQLAVAFDRARLTERERHREELERRRLRAELGELRHALQEAKLVHRSEEMAALLSTARRVAGTDATVLITGESGTGKELIARTVHELSPRRKKPFVVVDCSAIPTTLIESELFGYEKGAYTGAEHRKIGRLLEAIGGTVLLDEMGELPLEVQSKLLRFVQEKQLMPVGGTRAQTVDARVIAATNRDLAAEVKAGRFREDLYYRLNVVRLTVPPLRERPDDILYLADHFLKKYSLLYQKDVQGLTAEGRSLLTRYSWPGNVRELENRIMQAVILSETDELGKAELDLPLETDEILADPHGESRDRSVPLSSAAVSSGSSTSKDSDDAPWEELRLALARQIEVALNGDARLPPPLGRWLSEDLVLEADAVAGRVARRAASLVGIPETTFRRRLSKAVAQVEAGLSPRLESWQEVRGLLSICVRSSDGEDVLERTQRILLEEILARVPDDAKAGPALLGVMASTFRQRGALLEVQSRSR